MMKGKIQTVDEKKPERTDHIWFKKNGVWKCCLCGGVTRTPPPFPTPERWVAERYEKLTDEERLLDPLHTLGL